MPSLAQSVARAVGKEGSKLHIPFLHCQIISSEASKASGVPWITFMAPLLRGVGGRGHDGSSGKDNLVDCTKPRANVCDVMSGE